MQLPTFRTIVAIPGIFLTTGLAGFSAIVMSFLTRFTGAIDRISYIWASSVASVCGMKVRGQGMENIDPSLTYVVVSNHQSHMDTIALYCTSPVPLRMLAKASLFKIPVFGQAMARAGHIRIMRDKKAKTDFSRLLDQVETLKSAHRSIMVFAEGTRSPDGVVGPFKHGAFAIAQHFQLPILPVTIDGTHRILPARSLRFRAGTVRVSYHEPFEPGADSIKDLQARTRSVVTGPLEQDRT